MKGANGIFVIGIGVLIIWAVASGAGPCLGGALQCFVGGKPATPTKTP